ncbi:MAG: hypothetical protein ACI30J_07985 [Paludibacteraceae bacterium]
MKQFIKLCFFAGIALYMASCASVYEFVQVLRTQPTSADSKIKEYYGGMLYEDDICAIYYNFWSEGGNMGYEFHNKTNEIIYLDLGKSFFIINGIAHNCHNNRTLMSAQTSSSIYSNAYLDNSASLYTPSVYSNQTYTDDFGIQSMFGFDPSISKMSASTNNSTSTTNGVAVPNGVSVIESPIIAIPPKSSKFIGDQTLTDAMFLSCEREYYPSDSSMTSYSVEDSPLVFSNYISLRVGDNSPLQTIQNKFYVSSITNYAKPSTLVYIEREKECDNMLSMKEKQRNFEIYDAYLTINKAGAFFWKYNVYTKTKLYDNSTEYYWDSYYNGFIKYNMNTTNSAQRGKYVGGKLVE